MAEMIDYTNQKIGRVLILKYLGRKNQNNPTRWQCKCDCGIIFSSLSRSFKRGATFECEKCRYLRKNPDLTGTKLKRWTLLKRTTDKRGKTAYLCKCECGTERIVASDSLKKKRASMSCGCLGRKLKSKYVNPSLYPKESLLSTHQINFYTIRTSLIHKCYNEKHWSYKNFGAKGYTVCDLWRNDARAMYDWAIKNNWSNSDVIILEEGKKEFNPENCKIIPESEFRSIIAKKQGIFINIGGKRKKFKDVAAEKNISTSTVIKRMKKLNISREKALNLKNKTHKLKNIDETEIQNIKQLYYSNNSLEKIGRKYNVSGGSISYLLKKNNVKLKDRTNRAGITNDEVKYCLKQGMTTSQIAKKYNVTWQCIKQRINLINGIKRIR